MRDRLSIAALAFSGVAFLVALFSPAPQAPAESAGTRSEEIVNRAQGEVNALDEDGTEIEGLRGRGVALDGLTEKARPDEGRDDKLVEEMLARAVEARWPAFYNQLKIIRMYDKKNADGKEAAGKGADGEEAAKRAADAKAAEKKAADAKAAGKKEAPGEDVGKKPNVKPAVNVVREGADERPPAVAPGPWKNVPAKDVEKKGPPADDAAKAGAKAGKVEKIEKERAPVPIAPGGGNEAAKDGAKVDGDRQ